MKKLFLLLLLIALSLQSLRAFEYVDFGGIRYGLNENGSACYVTFIEGNFYSGDIVIPSSITYNGHMCPVEAIGVAAFAGCTGLKSVTIPSSVTVICTSAFCECTGLKSLTIPNSVTLICNSAFSGCTGLKSLTIPSSVTCIEPGAFDWWEAIDLTFEDGMSPLFFPWDKNQSIKLMFEYMPLETLYIGRNFSYPPELPSWYQHPFHEHYSLKSVTIGDCVTYIEDLAFYDCRRLSTVIIGKSVESIGACAFYKNDGGIEKIVVNSLEPPAAQESMVKQSDYQNTIVYVPKESLELYKSTEPWSFFQNIDILDNYEPEANGLIYVEEEGLVEVFDLHGKKVAESLEGLRKGVYVVRQGGQISKIAI